MTSSTTPTVAVSEVMHYGIITASPDAPLAKVAGQLAHNRVHCVVVEGITRRIPLPGADRNRTQGLLQVRGGMGEGSERVGLRGGGETWLARFSRTAVGSNEAPSELRCCNFCSGWLRGSLCWQWEFARAVCACTTG